MRHAIILRRWLHASIHAALIHDEFYDAEQNYWDEYGPLYEEINSLFYDAVVSSPYQK